MKSASLYIKLIALTGCILCTVALHAQVAEWRLMQSYYDPTDPDGAGPAVGSVDISFEMRSAGGSFTATDITAGFSWQSAKAMLPTTANCTGSPSSNINISADFSTATFQYLTVNQCNVVSVNPNGELFDRTVAGTLSPSSGGITLTTAWTNVFTVKLWALSPTHPQAGYAMVHSGDGGFPGPLSSYAMSITSGNGEAIVNSQTYTNALALGSNTLPVVLSNFDASCFSKGAKLNWQTATELNTAIFEIEKSSNGQIWTNIGSIKASGNSMTSKSYQFVDAAGGTALYRLKQLDKDGKFTYSFITSVNCQSKAPQMQVYPVPAKDKLNIVLPSDKAGNATVQIVDVLGRIHLHETHNIRHGSNNLQLNVSNMNSGEYFLRIIKNGEVVTQKIMIAQ